MLPSSKTLMEVCAHLDIEVNPRTRADTEAMGLDFTPLDPDDVIKAFKQLTALDRALTHDVMLRPSMATLLNGQTVYVGSDAATAEDLDNALAVIAAQVVALNYQVAQMAEEFVGLLRLRNCVPSTK